MSQCCQAQPKLIDPINQMIGNYANKSRWWSADVGDSIRDQGIAFMKASVKVRCAILD
jgi:hypothetical protein